MFMITKPNNSIYNFLLIFVFIKVMSRFSIVDFAIRKLRQLETLLTNVDFNCYIIVRLTSTQCACEQAYVTSRLN